MYEYMVVCAGVWQAYQRFAHIHSNLGADVHASVRFPCCPVRILVFPLSSFSDRCRCNTRNISSNCSSSNHLVEANSRSTASSAILRNIGGAVRAHSVPPVSLR